MRAFLVAGSPTGQAPANWAPTQADRVIAVDYGAHHALAWGWPVHMLIGDLDSLSTSEAAALMAAGVPVTIAPTAKDETDLELALAQALKEGVRRIVICAAMGGRTDHMLANVLLLTRPELIGVDAVIVEGVQTLRLLRGGTIPQDEKACLVNGASCLTLVGTEGDLLSLLPIGGDAVGVTTEGLAYPLRDETLFLGQARGVSNVFEKSLVHIGLRSGLLVVVHTPIDN